MAQSLMEKLKKKRERAFQLSAAESQNPEISSSFAHPVLSYQSQWLFEVCIRYIESKYAIIFQYVRYIN